MVLSSMKTTLLNKDLIFSCTSDRNYLDYIYSLCSSIKINSPTIPLHIRLVDINENDKQIISAIIKDRYKNTIIEFDDIPLSNKREFFRSKDKLLHGASINDSLEAKKFSTPFRNVKHNYFLMSERQCYTSNTRFRNIIKLFKEGYKCVLYIDADTIIRKDLNLLKNSFLSYDINCNVSICERYLNSKCWELSFLSVRQSDRVLEFIEMCKNIAENNIADWDADQNAIEEAYSLHFSDLTLNSNIKNIEDIGQLHNNSYSKESYIWAGSGTNKIIDKHFLAELESYYKI